MNEVISDFTLDAPKERRDAAEHRRRILVAARALFAAQGVDATNMTEIARAANIGQGTLYRRFAHKGELCEALLKENMQCFQKEMESRFAADQSSTALQRLELLLGEMSRFNEQNYPLLTAMIDSANGLRRGEVFQNPYYLWTHATIMRLLQQGMATGEVREMDADLTAHLMLAALKGSAHCHNHRQFDYSSEQIVRTVRGLLIEGLRTRP
jgi:AcrR family transcriptional regulator